MVYRINGKVNHGRVLYLALEDSRDRLIKRFRWVVDNAKEPLRSAVRKNIEVRTSWPGMYSGGVSELRKYFDVHPDTRLVIIDTAAAFLLGKKDTPGNAMQVEYALYKPLADLVMGRQCTILVVAHARKDAPNGRMTDPIDMVSGTLGGPAQCDTILTLYHPKPNHTALDITGRDLEGAELPLKSNNLFWEIAMDGKEKEKDNE
jgi:RecA-family ATPase